MSNVSTQGRRGRSKDGVNKALLIRTALTALGIDATAKEVQEHVAGQKKGVDVAPAQISNIRTKLKEKAAKKRPSRGQKGDERFTGTELEAAKPLVDQLLKQLGNHQRVVHAVALFDRLQTPSAN